MQFSTQTATRVIGGVMAVLGLPASLVLGATITVPAGGDINAALNRARSGDTVRLSRGTYEIDYKSLNLKSGVDLVGDGPFPSDPKNQDNFVTIKGKPSGNVPQTLIARGQFRDITIRNINFEDLLVTVRGHNPSAEAQDVRIKRCRFIMNRNSDFLNSMLLIYHGSQVRVSQCRFDANQPSADETMQGVSFSSCRWSYLSGNYLRGALRKGLYVFNSRNCFITGNDVRRFSNGASDHGIYVHQHKDIEISNNRVAGWADNPPGQSVKVKDGSRTVIKNNEFWTSGVVLRTEPTNSPNGTPETLVTNNILHQGGIDCWQPTRTVNGRTVVADQSSIRIENNTLYTGGVLAIRDIDPIQFNKSSPSLGTYTNGRNKPGGVHYNKARDGVNLKEGIFARGNSTSVGRDPNPNPDF